MKLKVYLGKLILWTVGSIFPSIIYPTGKIGNKIRCVSAKAIAKHVGKGVIIERGAHIKEDVVLNDYASVGEKCLISRGTVIDGHNYMGPNVHILTANHAYDIEEHRFSGYTEVKPVHIGENSWIGYNVIILPGVAIGKNTIIGAGSVVTKSIPCGVVAAGNPCVVKKILDPAIYNENN